MKKLFLMMVAALMSTAMSVAQSSLIATLSHEGEISTFYGAGALRLAHAAATNGDIITLSSGTFVSTDIKKGITLRGAGWEVDADNHSEPTVISGDFTIQMPEETTERLIIEGIFHNANMYYQGTLENATFLKSRFKKITYNSNGSLKNATFIHCRISEQLLLTSNSSASCISCVIWDPYTLDSSSSNFECINCIFYKYDPSKYLYSSTFKNCIFMHFHTGYGGLNGSNTVYNCITVRGGDIFSKVPNSTNRYVSPANIFMNLGTDLSSVSYNDNLNFELTDEAKTTYLGSDGTQVGIYGGTLPFSSTPTNPQITKCNVAAKSTADGKLSVEIEVSSAE